MDDSKSDATGSVGGKTIGTVSGALTLYLSGLITDNEPAKQLVFYLSPFVAVVAKDWGGALMYGIKLNVLSYWQRSKLESIKKHIDSLPDDPESVQVKKDASKEYYDVSGSIIMNNLKGVRRMSQLVEDKDAKGNEGDKE